MVTRARANAPATTATPETTSTLAPNVPETKPIANRIITLNNKGNKPGICE